MTIFQADPDRDLTFGPDGKPRWRAAATRRIALRDYQRTIRYSMAVRAPAALALETALVPLAGLPLTMELLARPQLVALLVARGARILFDHRAADLPPGAHHAAMSVTKTAVHLMIGRLVEDGRVDTHAPVETYLPGIAPGLYGVSVQHLLDMDVEHDYQEDGAEFLAISGSAVPHDGAHGRPLRDLLVHAPTGHTANAARLQRYSSINTEVLAWIAEAVSGRAVRDLMTDIVAAAGMADVVHIRTDSQGVPTVAGGFILTPHDLLRYGLLLARGGRGVDGTNVGSTAFTAAALHQHDQGTLMPTGFRYRSHVDTNGAWLGHSGFGGQRVVAHPDSGTVVAIFSAIDTPTGVDDGYMTLIARAADEIVRHIAS